MGKRWVHQVDEYDRERGISYWTKNYRTAHDRTDPEALRRRYEYVDPIRPLPAAGQQWWADRRAPAAMGPLAIGLSLTLIHLVSIPVTNTSVNPARSTGPAVFVGGWAVEQLWLFWLAPLVEPPVKR